MKENPSAQYSSRTEKKSTEITVKGEKKIGGAGYWIMLVIAIIDDALDILSTFFFFLINLIPIIGQALGAVSATLSIFLGMLITGTLLLYFHFSGVSLFSKKVASKLLLLLLEQVPLLGGLPFTTISFYLTIKAENLLRQNKATQLLSRKFEQ
jgi:hypothetical protein